MLLYVFTTEGGSREDGNVYYADFLLVKAPDSDKPQVDQIVQSFLGMTQTKDWDGNTIYTLSYDDLETKFGNGDIDKNLLKQLSKAIVSAGWKTISPNVDYITVDQ